MDTLLSECNLGINAIRQINDNKGMASYSLARIADYLDCSVDYLLGRTDIPHIVKTPTSEEGGGLDEQLNEQLGELKRRLGTASPGEKASAVVLLAAMLTKEQENHAAGQVSARQKAPQ